MSGQHVVIVTGGRAYPEHLRPVVYSPLHDFYALYGPFILFHGACTRKGSNVMVGADRYADDWGREHLGMELLERRPADWDGPLKNRAGPVRNLGMVREALKLAPRERIHGLAFPDPLSRGTWNCVRLMKDHGIVPDEWDVARGEKWLAEQGSH